MLNVKSENSPLQPAFNGVHKEFYGYLGYVVGRLFTIIDGVIVDNKQNKAVKDLIRDAIWDDVARKEKNIADWFQWIEGNYDIIDSKEKGQSQLPQPMKYDGPPAGNFRNY